MPIKTDPGNYFEDFALGQVLRHATPRTATQGDRALYQALYGSRFALQSDDGFARSLGLPESPLDDMLVFHLVFGKTVPDISLNAIANLGYAEGVFGVPLYPGDSVSSTSQVIGLKESSAGDSGIVYVRTRGANQRGEEVLRYVRWVLVRKRDKACPAPEPLVPQLAKPVSFEQLRLPAGLSFEGYDDGLAGSRHRFGRRIVYGGHVISLARALSFNGLANACKVLAINGGSHTAPTFAGDTLYAWSEVLESHALPGRQDAGLLRLRTVALKDKAAEGFPDRGEDGKRDPAVVLDLDYSVSMPR